MIAGVVCTANAANLRYRGSGAWENVSDGTSNGWINTLGTVPGTSDTARANWGGATITLDYEAPTINKFELGVDESGGFHILSGGILATLGDSRVGHNGGAGVVGTLTIDAGGQASIGSWLGIGHNGTGVATVEGILNVGGHLWMGAGGSGGNGTLTISDGGIVNVAQNIGLGTINASTASGGMAVINVNDGGLLNLYQWSSTTSIQDGSVLNINGTGTVIVGGNRVDQANDYFALGKIASDLGAINSVYTAEGDFTTITAIPEPATLSLLGLGALALLRKKK